MFLESGCLVVSMETFPIMSSRKLGEIMKNSAHFLAILGCLFFSVENADAASSGWMSYNELKKFAAKLKADKNMMDRLECYRDSDTGKRIFKVRSKSNRFKKQWQWAVESSVTNLNRKYISQGYRQISLSSNTAGKYGKWQCAVWTK